MDLWVVVAATGAGYLAKYWNKISRDGDSSYHLSSEGSYFENPESPSCPLSFLKQAQRGELGKDVSYPDTGLYRGSENNEMNLGLFSRSNDVVDPLIKPQLYAKSKELGKQALHAAKSKRLEIMPKQFSADWKSTTRN
ncbi:Valyl-tRNA synthetase [Sesbania bispinosa]|nr:Valyl-tRNA synthetase [Sesbania bispinosa]